MRDNFTCKVDSNYYDCTIVWESYYNISKCNINNSLLLNLVFLSNLRFEFYK